MSPKAWLRFGIGVFISALFVWLAFRGLDLAEIGQRIISARPAQFGLGVAAVLVSSLLRSYRWQRCFETGDGVTFGQAFGAYGLGALSTQVVPARLGDLIRIYVLDRNSPAGGGKALGTLVVERLSDMLAVVTLLAVLLPMFELPAWIKTGDAFAAVVAVVALAFVYVLARRGSTVNEPAWLKGRPLLPALFRILVQLIHGFSAVKSPKRGLSILLVAYAIWVSQIAFYLVCAAAIDVPLSWREASLLTCVLALSTIIPAGPGYAGSFELAAVSALALFSIDRSSAISYLELTRVAGLLGLLIWGAAGLASLRLSASRQPTVRLPSSAKIAS